MSLIALGGKINSGKSTVAKYLVDKYGFVELTFATPLKQCVKTLFNVEDKYIYDNNYKSVLIPELNTTGRKLLQVVGTELFRECLIQHIPNINLQYNSLWVHILVEQIKRMIKENPNIKIVVSDKRFENEYKALKDLNFTIYDIIRDINNVEVHSSEQESSCDEIINNNKGLDELYKYIDVKLKLY